MPDPIRFALEPEEALRAAQAFMDTLRRDARDAGIPVGVGFKNVQKTGKAW
nr:MAG TPA: Flagellar hook-length control protein FliK [Caudoviricetes sp.]